MSKRQFVTRAAWGLSLAATTALLAVPAMAQMNADPSYREKGFYIGGGIGANFQEDNHDVRGGTNSSYNPGPVGIMNFGYAFGNNLRLEIEPGYRYNDVDKISGTGAGGGRSQIFSTMGNVLWDFNQLQMMGIPVVPHIGAGVGWAHLWDQEGPVGGAQVKGQYDTYAYQAIGGVEYAMTPNLKLGIDYRYFNAQNASFRVNTVGGPRTSVGDFDDHSVLFTVRYSFGAPPAPMPAQVQPASTAPMPAQTARNYTVYFDFNRSDITPDAKPILQKAADESKGGNTTRVQVTGHTDRSGPDGYNQKLSERRAAAVKAELIKDGVPANEIVTVGKGESEPAVPTPDGVREPRNRRVVIELQGAGA